MNEPPYHPPRSPISPISQAAPTGARMGTTPGLRTDVGVEETSREGSSATTAAIDDLARIFNTVLISSLAEEGRDFPGEFYKLMESPAFRSILAAIQQHSRSEGITLRQATESVISTFRKVDKLWRTYIYREGVDRISSGSA